ncbi:MAG: FtsX-like permease family protein [Bacteroidales bacterium]
MLNQFISHFIWTLRKKPVYSMVTLIGFTIGITASLLIYLWVFDELSFDTMHADHERIYRVVTLRKQGQEIVRTPAMVIPLANVLTKDFPQIEKATFIKLESLMPLELDGRTIEILPAYTDKSFFDIFTGLRFVEGNAETVLNQPNAIVLNEDVAKKLFGDEPALGKHLVSKNFGTTGYVVGGVIRIPDQTHLEFGMITLMENNSMLQSTFKSNWRSGESTSVYLKLRKGAFLDETAKEQLSGLMVKYANRSDRLTFQPISDIHLNSNYDYQYDKNQGDKKYIWIFSGMAVLILLMAAFNFSALSTARSSERATEIGMLKTLGASRLKIGQILLVETLFQTIIAMILAILLVSILLPWFNNLAGKEIVWHLTPVFICSLVGIALVTGVLSALYPVVYLNSFNPVLIFKGGHPAGSRAGFISVMVVIQFIAATFMIAASGIVLKQLSYINKKELGLNKNNILVIPTGLWYSVDEFKSELLKNPDILSTSACTSLPVEGSWFETVGWNGMNSRDSIRMRNVWVDQDFAKTYDMQMITGDFLRNSYADYWSNAEKSHQAKKTGQSSAYTIPVVINEKAKELMGEENPVGKRLNNRYVIIGVVKDFHVKSLHHQIEPILILNSPEAIISLSIKISDHNQAQTIRFIQDTWAKFRGNRGFSFTWFEDQLAAKYQYETRLGKIILYFAILALLIALMGVLGLATYATERRTKEIGIRKINGSTVLEVMIWLNLDFLKWVAIGFIFACPAAIYFTLNWLDNFAYKTTGNWWIFVLAGFITFTFALAMVSWQSYRAATRNPVETLRYE